MKTTVELFVSNLSSNVTEYELNELFSFYGKVISVNIPLDGDGLIKGWGYVVMDNLDAAMKAISELNGKPYPAKDGRLLQVKFSIHK